MYLYSTFLSENVLGHGSWDEGRGPAVGFPQQEVGGRQLGGERQAGQGVHDQVHPQHLHCLQYNTLVICTITKRIKKCIQVTLFIICYCNTHLDPCEMIYLDIYASSYIQIFMYWNTKKALLQNTLRNYMKFRNKYMLEVIYVLHFTTNVRPQRSTNNVNANLYLCHYYMYTVDW